MEKLKSLKEICESNSCDKARHRIDKKGNTYADIYDRYFTPFRDKPINILELGCNEGSSLKSWKTYFTHPETKIYSIDINPNCKQYEDIDKNIFVIIASQTDKDKINEGLKDIQFDILLDDASHLTKYSIQSFEILFPRLKSDGIYIIEDLGCAYIELEKLHRISETWAGVRYNTNYSELNNDSKDLHQFTNSLIERIDLGDDEKNKMNLLSFSMSAFAYIHRYKFIMVIGKN